MASGATRYSSSAGRQTGSFRQDLQDFQDLHVNPENLVNPVYDFGQDLARFGYSQYRSKDEVEYSVKSQHQNREWDSVHRWEDQFETEADHCCNSRRAPEFEEVNSADACSPNPRIHRVSQ